MPASVQQLHLDELPLQQACLKCDSDLYAQHDGSCLTRDIAHQHETIERALQKLEATIIAAWEGQYRTMRLIVGGGVIRSAVLGQLQHYQQQGLLRSCAEESPNRGAILVQIRS